MNSESTAHGPFEQASPTRDWHVVQQERDLTAFTGVAFGLFILAAVAFGLWVAFQPVFDAVAVRLGVK